MSEAMLYTHTHTHTPKYIMSEAMLYTHTHTHTHTKVYTFGIYLGVELLDHIGSLCLTIEEVPYSSPQQLYHFSHP